MTSEREITLDSNPQEAEADIATAQFLRIYLNQHQPYLLPIHALVELSKVPMEQVMPMFGMAPWVIGVYNLRGEVLWIADLNHFLGFAPWYNQAAPTGQHALVVVDAQADGLSGASSPKLGLVVNRIADMVSYPEASIQTELSQFQHRSTTFICGAVDRPQGPQPILNIREILQTMAQPA